MRYIAQIVAYVLIILVVLGLFFLFTGEPDLWDKLHRYAMGPPCGDGEYLTLIDNSFNCKRPTP